MLIHAGRPTTSMASCRAAVGDHDDEHDELGSCCWRSGRRAAARHAEGRRCRAGAASAAQRRWRTSAGWPWLGRREGRGVQRCWPWRRCSEDGGSARIVGIWSRRELGSISERLLGWDRSAARRGAARLAAQVESIASWLDRSRAAPRLESLGSGGELQRGELLRCNQSRADWIDRSRAGREDGGRRREMI